MDMYVRAGGLGLDAFAQTTSLLALCSGHLLNLFKLWFPRLVNSSPLAVCALTLNANRVAALTMMSGADASAGRLKLLSLGVTPGSFQSQRILQAGLQASKVTAGWNFT